LIVKQAVLLYKRSSLEPVPGTNQY